MICCCSLAGTAACNTCVSIPYDFGSMVSGTINLPPYFPPTPKKIITEEFDEKGNLVKRTIQET